MCKSAESSFLDIYKVLRDVDDPQDLIEKSISASQRALDGYARVENIFQCLEQNQKDEVHNGSNSNTEASFNHKEFEERLKIDISEVSSSYENELKKREQLMRNSYEKQRLEAQQKFDSILAQKDSELSALNGALQEYYQERNQSIENQSMLQCEADKRNAAELKLKSLTHELEDLKYAHDDLKLHYETVEIERTKLRKSNENLLNKIKANEEEHQAKACEYKDEISMLNKKLSSMPDFDLSKLSSKLGISLDTMLCSCSDEHSSGVASGQGTTTWCEVEDWLVSVVRKNQTELSELRTLDAERSAKMTTLVERLDKMQAEAKEKDSVIKSMERDLSNAYSSIEAGKALLTCHKISADKAGEDKPSSLFEMHDSPSGAKESMMMKAILEQRDRAMKQARGKEHEAETLKLQVERLENDKDALKAENVELYKRIRVLRVNHLPGNRESAHVQGNMKKRVRTGDLSVEDDIEEKYSLQYEENLDLFQLEELDRQVMMSRMNRCEKGLALSVRFLVQDRWMRHAFLFYLLLVHLFAMGYVIAVLNPDIEREIDRQWARISKEDNNPEMMHPDNWA